MKRFLTVALFVGAFGGMALAQDAERLYSVKCGAITITVLPEGDHDGNAGILVGADNALVSRYIPEKKFPQGMNAFLVQVDGKNCLFDTGLGRKLFANLDKAGIAPDQIHAIFLTHMHGDHIGGMLRDDQPAFPHATVWLAEKEYSYWKDSDNRLALKVLEAYKARIKLFTPAELNGHLHELTAGVTAIAAYGHTPGHTAYLLQSKKDKLLLWGDLTHAMAVQMPHPEIGVTYDVDVRTATATRQTFLKYIAVKRLPVAGMHIPYPAVGIVTAAATGYKFVAGLSSE
ncbi:MAG: MBL fold metallo-hydrolase [Bacteroidales bacterium]|jgi:glyoxylase-like metal-dependent hydrolase (beta-lactamase superfamily II)|nr:MBL fold metallo-hydrolase [Bacteroidales bacterium]